MTLAILSRYRSRLVCIIITVAATLAPLPISHALLSPTRLPSNVDSSRYLSSSILRPPHEKYSLSQSSLARCSINGSHQRGRRAVCLTTKEDDSDDSNVRVWCIISIICGHICSYDHIIMCHLFSGHLAKIKVPASGMYTSSNPQIQVTPISISTHSSDCCICGVVYKLPRRTDDILSYKISWNSIICEG